MEHYTMNLTLKVWRQKNKNEKGSRKKSKWGSVVRTRGARGDVANW